MIKYAVFEIGGKQYKFLPKVPMEVDLQNGEDISAKLLMLVEDDKIKVGKPYLDEKLKIKKIEDIKKKKIRVAKFHAKANYRKVTGSRKKMTKVLLQV